MNSHLLVSDAAHFRIDYVINPYMDTRVQPDHDAALAEHRAIVDAHRAAGRRVEYLPSVPECPDMVFTANAAVVHDGIAVLGRPPAPRAAEIAHYRGWLTARGLEVHEAPYAFSGQGDALACGDLLLAGHGQRTDPRMLEVLAQRLDVEVVGLRTAGPAWYDLDLAVAVVDPAGTVAFCPDALEDRSVACLRSLGLDLVEVARDEAEQFALNLVGDGTTVTMTQGAPRLAADLRARGYAVVELSTAQLRTGGGGIRCTALALDSTSAPMRVAA